MRSENYLLSGQQELAYRKAKLRDIEIRIRCDGPHEARPSPKRARQFMPFAALKGYHELAYSKEYKPEPRREITEEHSLELSQKLASLSKGSLVRVVHYESGAYVQTVGVVSEVVEAQRILRIVRKPIAFADIFEIDQDPASQIS